jgi:hypothetical protein
MTFNWTGCWNFALFLCDKPANACKFACVITRTLPSLAFLHGALGILRRGCKCIVRWAPSSALSHFSCVSSTLAVKHLISPFELAVWMSAILRNDPSRRTTFCSLCSIVYRHIKECVCVYRLWGVIDYARVCVCIGVEFTPAANIAHAITILLCDARCIVCCCCCVYWRSLIQWCSFSFAAAYKNL